MRERADRVRGIPLTTVLIAGGAELDKSDPAKWHTSRGMISVTGCKFMNWGEGTGGGGAIDLVMHLYGLDFRGTLAWLERRVSGAVPDAPQSTGHKPMLKLPGAVPERLSTVQHYLIAQRRISCALVTRLIQCGDLYADHYANAVFVLRGKNNVPVGAELRGTGPRPWRGMAAGSRKHFGHFSIRASTVAGIILCESAIDAVSCFTIHPAHWCISTAGARPNPAWLPGIIENGTPVYCGFDDDPAGNTMAQAMIDIYPLIRRLRPTHHDWNDMLASLS